MHTVSHAVPSSPPSTAANATISLVAWVDIGLVEPRPFVSRDIVQSLYTVLKRKIGKKELRAQVLLASALIARQSEAMRNLVSMFLIFFDFR